MTSQLEQLRALSAVVADTGDIDAIARFPDGIRRFAADQVKLEQLLAQRL